MATFDGAAIGPQGAPAPDIQRGGAAPAAPVEGTAAGQQDPRSGTTLPAQSAASSTGDATGSPLQLSGAAWVARGHLLQNAPLAGWLLQLTGQFFAARAFQISAVYRSSDRLTLSGYAVDLAGQPLREYQLQFVGETVQQHFFGSATDLDGIYVAYLDTGDTYAIYAFHTTKGTTYRLESEVQYPNRTDLVFRLVTKRGGTGEGIFLQGG
jgi:hypothetical protein